MITYERVHELFDYNGHNLIWKVKRQGIRKVGVAGSIQPTGYRHIGIDYRKYSEQRLVWLYHYGYIPEHGLDHINRDRSDNRIKNLREVSQSCNMRNCGNLKNNNSGVKGVSFHKRDELWRADIRINNKAYHIGTSEDFDEAVLLRLAAEQCVGWDKCDKLSPAHKYAIDNKLIRLP